MRALPISRMREKIETLPKPMQQILGGSLLPHGCVLADFIRRRRCDRRQANVDP